MSLYFNDPSDVSPLTTAPQYNGNISGIRWKSLDPFAAETVLRAYGFTFDELNRLKSSDYGEGINLTTNSEKFNELIGSYDYNGNITSLFRSGVYNSTVYSDYDSLDYTYDGNKLIGVEDLGQDTIGFKNKHEYETISPDYEYDANGNMIKDLNKELVSINYNFLNLPSEVKKDNNNKIMYIYDAIEQA
jgi:hypothetical protein